MGLRDISLIGLNASESGRNDSTTMSKGEGICCSEVLLINGGKSPEWCQYQRLFTLCAYQNGSHSSLWIDFLEQSSFNEWRLFFPTWALNAFYSWNGMISLCLCSYLKDTWTHSSNKIKYNVIGRVKHILQMLSQVQRNAYVPSSNSTVITNNTKQYTQIPKNKN